MSSKQAGQTTSFAQLIYGGLLVFVCLIAITLAFSFEQRLSERNERATLYGQMIESTLSRTLEAMEITLSAFSDELSTQTLTDKEITGLREKLIKSLKFAPQLRQIVIVKAGKTLVDTRHYPAVDINESVLGFNQSETSEYSLGIMIGNQLRGRFFPYKGYFPDESEHRSLIPIALDVSTPTGESLRIIAAFNPSYIKRTIRSLPLQESDSVFITDFSGNSLIQHGLYGPYQNRVYQLIETALSQGIDTLQATKSESFIQTDTISLRLANKYPLAITLITDHQGSFKHWAADKSSLLLMLILVMTTLIIGATVLIRSNRQALEMKEEVHLLSEVVEHTPTVIVITNSDGTIEYVNESFERETGYKKTEVIGQNPRILKSGEKTAQEYQDMWCQLTSGKTWLGEFYNVRKDGTRYWERASIGPLKDTHGHITHYIALKQPIDKEKAAQEKIRLASTVFEAATEAIMVTDANRSIEMVNPAFQKITGYTEHEVIGKTPAILKSGKHPTAFYDALYSCLAERGSWEGEIWNRRKNGEIYPQWLMISSRRDQSGNIEGYVALFADITQRKKDEALIRQQANYDSVTSLPNRNLFVDRLNQALVLTDRNHSKTALLFIDLDRFKYVNDTYGHHVGDLLLQQVADRLRSEVRKSDTVARLGGDEFAVIISNITKFRVVEKVANKILQSLSQPYRLNEHEAYISCSIGIAFYPDHSSQPETLLIHADSAMYKAKQKGRNTYEYFNETLSQDVHQR